MSKRSTSNLQISIRLPDELKRLVKNAAVLTGQSVSDFVRTSLAREAESVLTASRVTRVSRRDWDGLLSFVENDYGQPNGALRAAARRYKRRLASD